MAPVQIYTHDYYNYEEASALERQTVIRDVSSWLEVNDVRHIFMENLGDYIYARTKSVLTDATLSGNDVTFTFTGNSSTIDSEPIDTQALVFYDEMSEGSSVTIPGFIGGATITMTLAFFVSDY